MTIESYLKLYTSLLVCGAFTILVIAALVMWGWYIFKWTQSTIKLITWYFERKMQPHLMKQKLLKAKVKVVKAFSIPTIKGNLQIDKKTVSKELKEAKT